MKIRYWLLIFLATVVGSIVFGMSGKAGAAVSSGAIIAPSTGDPVIGYDIRELTKIVDVLRDYDERFEKTGAKCPLMGNCTELDALRREFREFMDDNTRHSPDPES